MSVDVSVHCDETVTASADRGGRAVWFSIRPDESGKGDVTVFVRSTDARDMILAAVNRARYMLTDDYQTNPFGIHCVQCTTSTPCAPCSQQIEAEGPESRVAS